MDAETISNKIIEVLKKLNINLSNLRGQGYDGASTIGGVNVKIKEKVCEQVLYVHCSCHALNLVLHNGCSIYCVHLVK